MHSFEINHPRVESKIMHTFVALATATSMTFGYSDISDNDMPEYENIQVKTGVYGAMNKESFYKSMTTAKIESMESILDNMLDKYSQFNFIKVDEALDKEIDSYFAQNPIKKKKNILLHRSS
ncbi:MAG: hypothetical protein KAI79_05020 [Bacteroidales bacterium]|nr:hypothetical protein [Bacteroidales bacterium]